MILILMGAPGAGKGSAAELLKDTYNLLHISTGDMFRENIKNNTELGKEAKTYIDKGNLVPDFVTCKLVRERLSRDDVKQGFILDGFPRNQYQAEQLDIILSDLGLKLTKVLNIVADDELIAKRLDGRRVCPKCGTVYHITRKPSKVEGICDLDQEALIKRADDDRQTILERLAIYHGFARPLEQHYEKQGLLVNIDGNNTIKDSFVEIEKILGEK